MTADLDKMNKMEGLTLLAADAFALRETFNPIVELKVPDCSVRDPRPGCRSVNYGLAKWATW
jgi:hypothetical protein